MKRQKGLSLISTAIIGILLIAVLILGFKMVPVYNEYFGVKKAFNSVIAEVDPTSAPTAFRSAFQRFKDVSDLDSIDPQAIDITKDSGRVTMQISYRRDLPLFANVGLYFNFDVSVTK